MYISKVHIRNFRNFGDCEIPLNKGLSVLVGENNVGKTNFLAVLALIFSPDVSARARQLTLEDFWSGCLDAEEPPEIRISCTLVDIQDGEESSTVAKWWVRNAKEARITYLFRCTAKAKSKYSRGQPLPVDDYEWVIFGGDAETRDPFEYNQLRKISLDSLDALRDAERALAPSIRGPLARVLNHFPPNPPDVANIDTAINQLHSLMTNTSQLRSAQDAINARLKNVSGQPRAQDTRLTPVGASYDDLMRNLEVEVRSAGEEPFRGLDRNGLGYNNLLFISVLLTDYLARRKNERLVLPIMAIEEPEAHLHPQLQKTLNRNFEATADAAQVIATTHSTHVTSSVSLDSIVVFNRDESGRLQALRVADLFCGSEALQREKLDLERYLDATKSTLFFGKSVLLVEGMAEALLLPVLAKTCSRQKCDLDEVGISVVAVNGLAFRPFLHLFGEGAIHRRCAALTDSDSEGYPLTTSAVTLGGAAAGLIDEFGGGRDQYTAVFHGLKTLEYDLATALPTTTTDFGPSALGPNRAYILRALANTPSVPEQRLQDVEAATRRDEFGKAVIAAVEKRKGRFAQALAAEIDDAFTIPRHIQDALDFLLGGV